MAEPTIEDRVAAGAAWLDERIPEWVEQIDLFALRLSDGCRCILGQTFGDYTRAPISGGRQHDEDWDWDWPPEYDRAAAALGFQASEVADSRGRRAIVELVRDREYDALQEAWTRLVLGRREVRDAA